MQVDIYYSGYISIEVEDDPNATSYAYALEKARQEAERLRTKQQGKFIEEIMPNFEPWPEADQIRD